VRDLAHLDQVRHHRPGIPAEQSEQFLEQAGLHRGARGGGLEHVRIADLLGAPHRALGLEPVNHGLHRGVGRFVALHDGFVDLADRAAPRLQNSDMMRNSRVLSFGSDTMHPFYYRWGAVYDTCSRDASPPRSTADTSNTRASVRSCRVRDKLALRRIQPRFSRAGRSVQR
jgi:hypothetical protein